MASLLELKNLNEETKNKASTSKVKGLQLLTKTEQTKQRIKCLLLNSTANGVPNMLRARNMFLKIMWLTFLIFSTCAGSYYTIDSIIDFFKYSSVTLINVINEQQSQFPTISFCSSPEFKITIDQIIISVNFERIAETNLSHFEEFEDFSRGKCFRYNSGRNIFGENFNLLNSSKGGFSFSLRINIYFKIPNEYDFGEFLVNIHNYSSPPYDMQDGGYWLRAGTWNYFEVERIFTQNLEEPYNNCLKNISLFKMNKTLIDYIAKSNLAYTQINCFRLCSNLYVIEESNCGCNSSLNKFENNCILLDAVAGTTTNTSKCVLEYLKEFRNNLQFSKCYQYCPLECDSLSYNIKINTESFPVSGNLSDSFKKEYAYLQRFNTYEEVNRHYIGLRVYYKDLKYTLVTQQPKTEVFNFVSNIGGIFGLFLGISFLSFIETIEILSEIFLIIISSNKIYV